MRSAAPAGRDPAGRDSWTSSTELAQATKCKEVTFRLDVARIVIVMVLATFTRPRFQSTSQTYPPSTAILHRQANHQCGDGTDALFFSHVHDFEDPSW